MATPSNLKGGASTIAMGLAVMVSSQTGFNIGGGSVSFVDRLSGPEASSNSSFSSAAVSGLTYSLGNSVTFQSGTLNQVAGGAWPADASIRLRNSAFPTLSAYIQITTVTAFSGGTFTIPIGSVRPFGNENANWTDVPNPPSDLMSGAVIPAGSVWSTTYYTNFNTAGGTDVTAVGLVFEVAGTPLDLYDTGVMAGPFEAFGPPGTPGNTEILGPVVPVTFRMGSEVRLSGNGQSQDFSAPAEQRIRLRNTAFPNFFSVEIRPSVVTVGGGTLNLSDVRYNTSESIFARENRMQNTLRGLMIPAGSRFLISVFDVIDIDPSQLDYSWTNLRMVIQEPGTAPASASPPIEPIKVGTLWRRYATLESAATVEIPFLGENQVRWIQFDLEQFFNQREEHYLNLWTERLGLDNPGTVLALFNEQGKLLAYDASSANAQFSSLTFGKPAATPWALNTGGLPNSGRDGFGLPKGRYYLGVGTWSPSTVIEDGFVFQTQGPAAESGFRVRIMTNAPVQEQTLTVPLEFLGTADNWAVPRILRYRVLQAGAEIVPWTAFSSSSRLGSLTIRLPSFISGPASIEVDAFTITGGSQTLNMVRARNGDVDNNGEVDLTDIDLIIGDYLGAGGTNEGAITDLDNNGEVDLTDIDIAIGNYLESDES